MRLIFIAFLLVTGAVLLHLAWNAALKILQSIVKLAYMSAKVVGAALVAGLAGLVAFVVLPIAVLGDWFGIAVVSVAIAAFVLCWRKFAVRDGRAARPLSPMEEDQSTSLPIVEEVIKPEADPRIAEAWEMAGELAPEYAQRLSAARRHCAQVLEMAAGGPVEWSIVDCSTFISRTVPDAVSTAAALMMDADHSERSSLAGELVVDLERIASRAREEVDSRRRQLRNSWHVIRTHIASRTARDAS
ncbi:MULTISPECIES: hypothetical protein [unclassified Sphingobium]|uniref:hypothetical protein n=1 Tax=unclassified Sphingobium TaxID=2611147 RepID=UPI00076FE006|nr:MULTISPECIES: hypothetical protein [unclassified Sphingobium]AMK16797.1 hypothetical protein K663_02030 [Sphingobium sp. MI1205]